MTIFAKQSSCEKSDHSSSNDSDRSGGEEDHRRRGEEENQSAGEEENPVVEEEEENRREERPAGSSAQHARENMEEELPTSVRGAPEHMREAIRRRQNMESARRTRQRKAEALEALIAQHHQQVAEIEALEERVQNLTKLLEEAGFTIPDQEAIESVIDEDGLFQEILSILDDGIVEETPDTEQGDESHE